MSLIRHEPDKGTFTIDDAWVPLSDEGTLPSEDVIVSLERLEQLEGEVPGRLAVRVDGATDPGALAPHLDRLSMIAIELPKFTDGRAYSLARLLRDRHEYTGTLRAVGHVLRDQLFYMWRCGFDEFELAEGVNVDDAVAAFDDFTVTYQPAEDHAQPIWRRRRGG